MTTPDQDGECTCRDSVTVRRLHLMEFAEGAEWAMGRLLDWGTATHGEPRKALYVAQSKLAVELHGILSRDEWPPVTP